jgi:hypothetical protein
VPPFPVDQVDGHRGANTNHDYWLSFSQVIGADRGHEPIYPQPPGLEISHGHPAAMPL